MPRNSKDNSLKRYKLMLSICEKYSLYTSYPKARIIMDREKKEKLKYALHYVKLFKETLSHQESLDKEMINNEFILKNDGWWITKYSRATYYRYRNKAILNFLTEFPL